MGWVIKVEVRVCSFVRIFSAVDECDVYTRANMNDELFICVMMMDFWSIYTQDEGHGRGDHLLSLGLISDFVTRDVEGATLHC